jgi:hypothetical protein
MSFAKTKCLIVSFPRTINYKFVTHLPEHTTYPKKGKKSVSAGMTMLRLVLKKKCKTFRF